MTLAIDYAWQHPSPAAIRAASYVAVGRYFSHDPTKDLTASEASALHAAGLSIFIVFETSAQRAAGGFAAGQADAAEAEARAAAMGYPVACPLFYAVDFDAAPAVATSYFQGVRSKSVHAVGMYGGYHVIEAVVAAGLATYVWQASAWSQVNGVTTVSPHAHLFQRVKHTGPSIAGIPDSAWDEDVILQAMPFWGPAAAPAPKPPAPAPKPTPAPIPLPVLKLGSRGSAVRNLQLGLNRVFPAYSHLVADGVFGQKTDAVVREFQRRSNLTPVDGVVGPITRAALRRSGVTF